MGDHQPGKPSPADSPAGDGMGDWEDVTRGGSSQVNNKKRKNRKQKVDPSILGFSATAAERPNIGEIQTIDD